MNLYFTVFTLHSIRQYIVVFYAIFDFLDLNLKKPKKNIKNHIKTKDQISNLKNHWFFPPLVEAAVSGEIVMPHFLAFLSQLLTFVGLLPGRSSLL